MARAFIVALLLLAACCRAAAADAPPGTVTILEGKALVYRGVGRLQAQEGMRLGLGDIVETDRDTLLQVELADRSLLQLGAATRVMLLGGAPKAQERWAYLMDGWLKAVGAAKDAAGAAGPPFRLRTPLLDIDAGPAVYVMQAGPAGIALFAERDALRLTERGAGAAPAAVALSAGEHYRRSPGARGVVNPGTLQALVAEMPRAFRDAPPRRLERFREVEVAPKPAPDFAYADVQSWLGAEPWLRRQFVARWRAKARDAAFRAALAANLAAHPEWDPVLYPEKYLPKPSPAAASAPPAGAAVPAR
jgi:hypothetical protein